MPTRKHIFPVVMVMVAVALSMFGAAPRAAERVALVIGNPLARSLARSMGPTRSSAIGRGLGRVETASGTLIAYATQPGNVADDGEGRNSPFTAALLAHITTPGLSVNDLLTSVRDAVLATTGGRQEPFVYGSFRAGARILRRGPRPSRVRRCSLLARRRPAPLGWRRSASCCSGSRVKDSEHPVDIQAYLDRVRAGAMTPEEARLRHANTKHLRRASLPCFDRRAGGVPYEDGK